MNNEPPTTKSSLDPSHNSQSGTEVTGPSPTSTGSSGSPTNSKKFVRFSTTDALGKPASPSSPSSASVNTQSPADIIIDVGAAQRAAEEEAEEDGSAPATEDESFQSEELVLEEESETEDAAVEDTEQEEVADEDEEEQHPPQHHHHHPHRRLSTSENVEVLTGEEAERALSDSERRRQETHGAAAAPAAALDDADDDQEECSEADSEALRQAEYDKLVADAEQDMQRRGEDGEEQEGEADDLVPDRSGQSFQSDEIEVSNINQMDITEGPQTEDITVFSTDDSSDDGQHQPQRSATLDEEEQQLRAHRRRHLDPTSTATSTSGSNSGGTPLTSKTRHTSDKSPLSRKSHQQLVEDELMMVKSSGAAAGAKNTSPVQLQNKTTPRELDVRRSSRRFSQADENLLGRAGKGNVVGEEAWLGGDDAGAAQQKQQPQHAVTYPPADARYGHDEHHDHHEHDHHHHQGEEEEGAGGGGDVEQQQQPPSVLPYHHQCDHCGQYNDIGPVLAMLLGTEHLHHISQQQQQQQNQDPDFRKYGVPKAMQMWEQEDKKYTNTHQQQQQLRHQAAGGGLRRHTPLHTNNLHNSGRESPEDAVQRLQHHHEAQHHSLLSNLSTAKTSTTLAFLQLPTAGALARNRTVLAESIQRAKTAITGPPLRPAGVAVAATAPLPHSASSGGGSTGPASASASPPSISTKLQKAIVGVAAPPSNNNKKSSSPLTAAPVSKVPFGYNPTQKHHPTTPLNAGIGGAAGVIMCSDGHTVVPVSGPLTVKRTGAGATSPVSAGNAVIASRLAKLKETAAAVARKKSTTSSPSPPSTGGKEKAATKQEQQQEFSLRPGVKSSPNRRASPTKVLTSQGFALRSSSSPRPAAGATTTTTTAVQRSNTSPQTATARSATTPSPSPSPGSKSNNRAGLQRSATQPSVRSPNNTNTTPAKKVAVQPMSAGVTMKAKLVKAPDATSPQSAGGFLSTAPVAEKVCSSCDDLPFEFGARFCAKCGKKREWIRRAA